MIRYNAGSVKYQRRVKTLSANVTIFSPQVDPLYPSKICGPPLPPSVEVYIPWLHASSDQIHSSDATVSYTLFSKWLAV